ncbi:hypothetical protein MBANPS3_001280 [Mucor bainieri]
MQHSSAAWAELPKELQRLVFSEFQFDTKALFQIQLTCRSWRRVAEEFLYHDISLKFNSTGVRNIRLITTLELPNNPCRLFVKTLKLHNSHTEKQAGPAKNLTALLLRLLLNCPNLTKIENLGSMPATDYYDTIRTLRREGHLQKVGFIGCFKESSKEAFEGYNKTILELASTIHTFSLMPCLEASTLENGSTVIDAFPLVFSLKGLNLCQLDPLLDATANSLNDLHIVINEADARFGQNRMFEALPGSRRFAKLNLVDIRNVSLLTDQDMLYIMHKFLSVNHLDIDCDYEQSTQPQLNQLPSASVVHKFIAYLSQFSCRLDYMTISTKALIGVASLLSASPPIITKVKVFACSDPNIQLPKLTFLNRKLNKNTSKRQLQVKLPSSNMEPLYKHLLSSFCQSLERLTLCGKPDDEEHDLNERSFTALQRSQNVILNDSIDTIWNSYEAIRKLTLQMMILMPLSLSITNMSVKRQLETLKIESCSLHPHVLSQLSQRVKYINCMHLLDVHWIQDDLTMGGTEPGCTISMPFTEFNSIHLEISLAMSKARLFKIWTGSRVVRFKLGGAHDEAHDFLTEDEFDKTRRSMIDPWIIMIYCASCNFISVNDYTVPIDE